MKPSIWLLFLIALYSILLIGCTPDEPLPCPLPREMMDNPADNAVAFSVQNNACVTLCSVYIAQTSCDNWGIDWVDNDSLRTGESVTAYLPAGKYDVLLEDCTGLSFHFYEERVNGINDLLISDADAKKKDTCQAALTVVNHTEAPICHLWIAAEHSESFGGNWLGQDQIAPGESDQFFVFPGTYDIKAEDCDFNILRLEMDTEIEDHLEWVVE
jgi:hypothetical protein